MSKPTHLGDRLYAFTEDTTISVEDAAGRAFNDVIWFDAKQLQALDSYRRQLPPEHPCHLKPL